MKKFISMLLVTAFMLVAFSALGAPAQAIVIPVGSVNAYTPHFEKTVSTDSPMLLTVERSGFYIIQTFGFCDNCHAWGMTLADRNGNPIRDVNPSEDGGIGQGYADGCFMYVGLSSNTEYILEINDDVGMARLVITYTSGLFVDGLAPSSYYSIHSFEADTETQSFTFHSYDQYEAQVCLVWGSGTYEISIECEGFGEAFLLDPREIASGASSESSFASCQIYENAENMVPLEDGVPYFLVVYIEHALYPDYPGIVVDEIELTVHFRRISD